MAGVGDALVHAELLAACSALGYCDGSKYYCEADCLETTKDLVRYLRRDDDSHEVRRALGDTRVLQTDLIPLVRDHSTDAEQFDVTIRLLVNLTNPVLLLFREELPEEKVTRQQFLQLITHQQRYKEAFVETKVWEVLVGKLGDLLQLDWENRQEEDRLLVERILILIRNILAVPTSPEDEKRTDDDASIHDQVLWALHLAGLEDLLMYIASSQSEQDLCMHVLEIISLMLREQDPAQLALAGLQRSEQEKEKDEQALVEARRREALQRQQQKNKQYAARHSRFGGTYYVQNMKSISDRDIITHQSIKDIKSLNFDRFKKPKRHPKHRAPMRDSITTRRSTLAIRLFLQDFCIEFLNGAYNSIMYIVKDNLNRSRAQDHDESYYLWSMKFFMEFNRHHQFKIELVSETLSVESFHYIQTQIDNYYENMATDKKKIPIWFRRMHKALRAYQELLMTLAAMDKCQTEGVKESARILKSKVFYVVEYREMVLVLLQNFDPIKMTLTYLKDVVETAHIFLKLVEAFTGKNRHLMVQKVVKKHPKKKKKATSSEQTEELSEEQLQDLWDNIAGELSAVVQGEAGELPEMIPLDTLSEDTEDQMKETAMRRINKLLRNKELPEGVSLMRSSRACWPEGDVFGAANMDHSAEFLALREVFMANLNPPQKTQNTYEDSESEDEEVAAEREEREEEAQHRVSEQEFNFRDFVRRFANTKVMEAYARLLSRYTTNSSHTNHCILKLFHRIAWDCKMPAIFFQASIFLTFQNALEDPRSSTNDSVREIARFGKYIVRQFFKVAETNSKVFFEIFFWKNNKEALEIECGYDEPNAGKQALKQAWAEEEEEELRVLYEEMKNRPPEELEDKDVIDLVMENLINQNRTRRAVIKKLKELGLIKHVNDVKRKTGTNLHAPKQWSEEEEGELKMLFEDNRGAMDIVGCIMHNKVIRRPKNRIVEKILELGLVADRSELRKKKVKKSKPRVDTRGLGERFVANNQGSDDDIIDDDDEEIIDSDSSDSDDGPSQASQRQNSKKPTKPAYTAPIATPALISQSLREVVDAGMVEAVEWLVEVITDVADDREEDGDFEPVPILAIAQACVDALEDPKFHKLLQMVGLQPPQNHQEMYWRVPSRLTVPALRKRASYLTQGLAGDPILPDNPDQPLETIIDNSAQEGNPDEPLEFVDEPKKRQKKSKPKVSKKKSKKSTEMTEESEAEDKENEHRGPLSSQANGNIDDDSDDSLPLLSLQNTTTKSHKKGLLSSANDSDEESIKSSSKKKQTKKKNITSSHHKRNLSSGDDSEDQSSKSQKVQTKKKKRRLVMADDSEDEEGTQTVDSQNIVLHLDTEQTQDVIGESQVVANSQRGRKMIDSDSDADDVPLVVGRQRARAVIESDDE